ncbi:MAG: hypothetical protein L0Z53_22415 [Acidobacteriales bacterium]|nr:hypothetical protein [Terriglobales bacterium]
MQDENRGLSRSQWNLIFLILGVTFASILYRILAWKQLEHTSLLFIGIPASLAVVVAFAPKAKTVTGSIVRAMTIALLISGILLGEGFICIVMAAPLFYLVGVIVGQIIEAGRRARNVTMSCLLLLPFLSMSFEGTSQKLSLPREESVTVARMVNASAEQVEQALAKSPRVGGPLPLYLRLGFPRPLEATGDGLEIGRRRLIHFSASEAGHSGDLVMQVAARQPGLVRFDALSDHTHIIHWLAWRSAEVRWSRVDDTHTRVEWRLNFRRRLDPAWYFRPWQRYAVRLAADYLITNNATPASIASAR